MSKSQLISQDYEAFIELYIDAKTQTQVSLINYANVLEEALTKLGKKQWINWLSDTRVNLQKSQAYKFVALSLHCKNSVQLTGLLKNTKIEKAYLITKIKKPERQAEVAEKVIEADFTVKQAKKVVELVNEDLPTEEALKQAKEEINNQRKITPEKVPKELYDKLKEDYENLLAQYKQLQGNIVQSDKPEMTIEKDGTLDKINRKIAFKGYWIPVSSHINIEAKGIELDIKYDAISNAKKFYNLDLDDHLPVMILKEEKTKIEASALENMQLIL